MCTVLNAWLYVHLLVTWKVFNYKIPPSVLLGTFAISAVLYIDTHTKCTSLFRSVTYF